MAANVLEHGTGGINVDGCRLGTDDQHKAKCESAAGNPSNATGAVYGEYASLRGNSWTPLGRWPANVALDPEAVTMLDKQTGESVSRIGKPRTGQNGAGWGMSATGAEYDDQGGASRFFYCAKTSRGERNAGLDGFEAKPVRPSGAKFGEQTMWNGENGDPEWRKKNPNNPAANVHPTVKPIALMRWLVRLVTPPGGTVLDPFTGSGSTGCAAVLEGFDFIGCEREAEYVAIAEARIVFWAQHVGREVEDVLGLVNASVKARKLAEGAGQGSIFDDSGLELDLA